jgi:uncharacterized protein involved in tolerance to divalent cations
MDLRETDFLPYPIMGHVTCPSDVAKDLAMYMVAEHLVACVSLVPNLHSM